LGQVSYHGGVPIAAVKIIIAAIALATLMERFSCAPKSQVVIGSIDTGFAYGNVKDSMLFPMR